jgi:glycerophosphoryl diester phosphodiesterase
MPRFAFFNSWERLLDFTWLCNIELANNYTGIPYFLQQYNGNSIRMLSRVKDGWNVAHSLLFRQRKIPHNHKDVMPFFDNFKSIDLVGAHRGYRARYPENTLLSFCASIGRCHFIELDIQMSKDFVPVVCHDPSLERTSNAKTLQQQLGLKSLAVCDWTLHQLKTLDVGLWFLQADPFAAISNKEISIEEISRELPQRIMTLEEVLLHPYLINLPINVEIKDHRGRKQHNHVTEAVVEVIRKTGSTNRVLISSFNHDYLVLAKKISPKLALGALQDSFHPADLIEYLRSLGAVAYHPSDSIVDAKLIKKLRPAGIAVNVYTVNSKERQKQLFSLGATAVFTDYPQLA